ncbi:HAMP domain-containing sensor histidine kinase [Conexibacter sp. SYSU D00693]|uniref:sensor histidine kinase n=1 Tax=Conexibacter sp. SYSU D00693 TaxID=2812560 RepID=UPI00196A3F36|nr:HAMP domain-containing sensor histidine kinase [Conexibacter sp. SYSU D00693]
MRGLRGRLTLGLTLVLAAVLAAAGLYVAHDADRSEREVLDDRLQRTAELSTATAVAAVQEGLPGGDRRLDAVLSATSSSLRLFVGRTPVLDTGRQPPPHPRLPRGFATFEADGTRYRAFTTRLRDPSLGGLVRLEVTTTLTALERRQARLRRRLALIGLAALAVCAALTFLATSVVLAPLRRLRSATAEIAGDEDLDRRVAADGPFELRALASSFNAMLARLGRSAADRERALAATRRFAADAGHELRTPLTSLQATLSSLSRHPDLPAERRSRMLEDAADQQHRLVALLDGLQALARGDAAPPDDDVDLAELVDVAVSAAAERHPAVRFVPELPEDPVVVRGWAPGLRSIADNLLQNAALHGASGGGTVRVALEPGPVLVVEDDGPGIPEADRERVLEPFTRLGAGEAPGSGLGLAVVAQQARHHGAELAIGTSQGLGGARLSVRFGASS